MLSSQPTLCPANHRSARQRLADRPRPRPRPREFPLPRSDDPLRPVGRDLRPLGRPTPRPRVPATLCSDAFGGLEPRAWVWVGFDLIEGLLALWFGVPLDFRDLLGCGVWFGSRVWLSLPVWVSPNEVDRDRLLVGTFFELF